MDERTCIIIAELSSFSVGLIVDTVHEVSVIKEDEIVLPPPNLEGITVDSSKASEIATVK